MHDTDLSIQTAKAFKSIIRFMQSRGLKAGDHLPPQQELRRILGFSNDTLTGAMNRLVSEGVVTRKRRVGTVVLKPEGPEQIAWSVGVATRGVTAGDSNAFRAEVAHRLVSYLLINGCSCRLYHLPPNQPNDNAIGPAVTAMFHGLPADLTAGRLDAVIFNAVVDPAIVDHLGQEGVEAIKVSRMGPAPKGVVVDEADALLTGLAHLVSQGARRVLVVGHGPLDRWHPSVSQALTQASAQYAGKLADLEYRDVHAGGEYGRHLAAELSVLPPEARPDGVILGDDFTGTGFAEALRGNSDYQPAVAVMTSRQVPLFFPMPVTRLELDVDQLAALGVQLLMQRLRNPALPAGVEWVRRTLIPAPAASAAAPTHAVAMAR